jgi:hypothetical protein
MTLEDSFEFLDDLSDQLEWLIFKTREDSEQAEARVSQYVR